MRTFIFLMCSTLLACSNDAHISHTATEQKKTVLFVSSLDDPKLSELAINKALLDAKALLATGKPVEVRLKQGTYYLSKTIQLDHEYSGNQEQPFIFAAEQGSRVVLSGAKPLSVVWQRDGELLKAVIESDGFDQLFINGQKQIRARYPNYDPEVKVFNGYAEDAISSARVATWKNPKGGVVHALHEGRWGGMHYLIEGKEQGELKLLGGFQNNRQSPMHTKYRYVENIFEELDAPSEWYFDEQTDTLYFYPPDDFDLSNSEIEITSTNHLIELVGSESHPVKNIRVENFVFTQTNQTFMQTKEPLLRSDWAVYRGGAVLISNAQKVEVKNNVFKELGGNAIFVSDYSRDIKIAGNEIYNIGASAVSFVGSATAVRSPSFEYHQYVNIDKMDLAKGPKNERYPSNSVVFDNLIHDIGQVEKQVAGVQLSMSANVTVSHNTIYRVPRAGINVSEGTWGGHVIEHNDVFSTVLETGDHGAFNSWGRDRFWHPDRAKMNQLAKEYPGLYRADVIKPIIIRNNRFQCDYGWDIDLDDGSSNYEIYNNVLLSGGLKLREGFRRKVENNVILNNSFHPHVWFENSEDIFRKNIVLASHKPILNNHWGQEIDFNLFTTERALVKAQNLGLDKHSTYGNPQFVDPSTGDYRVSAGSPALSLGFKNFAMDQFGVTSPRLKAQAESPSFPNLYLSSNDTQQDDELTLFGATFKSVTTLGEQSALGIPEIAGALVTHVKHNSQADEAGLVKGDVILRVIDTEFSGVDKIINIKDLLTSYRSRKWRGELEVVVVRNQNEHVLVVNLLD
ncbi:PDZ domain-containing protein [Pseudoalteromonas sp. UCD-33C]|uniref:PDZ domain-containing protein n=1 Tax=Pseudoalteromonas sp. UCD-33C TaxID=1716175 RepID=UPI0006CA0959|nr:PDZ domain-containing protein [Pseudoalteromonas sp. UCD-33C]